MQTDRLEDRGSARLKQFRTQRLKRLNGNQNGMVNVAGTQSESVSFSQVSNMYEDTLLKEALCDQSTMQMETITPRTLARETTNIPFLDTLPMPAVPTPI